MLQKISKKNFQKKIQKKLKKGYQDFHAPKQGRGGMGLYRCVMVITLVQARRQARNRHGDMGQIAETERYHPFAYLSGLVRFGLVRFTLVVWVVWSLWACRLSLVGLLWFSWFSWFSFLPLHKIFFIFPNFFANYLIINAFQI